MKEDITTNSITATTTTTTRRVQMGDIVTMDLALVPENSFVPEPLLDTRGRISFVVGWGNYLPGLHELVLQGCDIGDAVDSVSIDAGYGHPDPDLILTIPKHKLKKVDTRIGRVIYLQGKYQVRVTDIQPDAIVVDANPPLAGTSYACSFQVLNVESLPHLTYSKENTSSVYYQVATFALGCFWGAELAYMRTPGVVGTKVGYAQVDGQQSLSSRESVMVVYDSRVVSYDQLLQVAMDRLTETNTTMLLGTLFQQEDEDYIYKHGFYYHTESQRQEATRLLQTKNRFGIEVLRIGQWKEADEFHQQYLYKGGQSARKGAKEKIRCYG